LVVQAEVGFMRHILCAVLFVGVPAAVIVALFAYFVSPDGLGPSEGDGPRPTQERSTTKPTNLSGVY
jgi:hypothetical protein